MKAIILSRVSTGHQDLDSQTIKVKTEVIKDGYTENDIIIIEDIESAVKLSEEERNGLNRLKDYIKNDPSINCVYTYEVSRISRQASIVYSIRDFLIEHHVQLVVINPYFKMLKDDGTLSETSNIFFGIFGAMSENEGYLRKARIKKAVEKYRAEGRHTGGPIMFGYDTDEQHRYIPHKEDANVVKMIYHMYVDNHLSIRSIAKELRERGVQLRSYKMKGHSTSYLTMCVDVNTILKRREYIGEGRPQIISKELFDKAQEIMKSKTIYITNKKVDALLRGMIRNKENGLLLSANATTKYYYSKRIKGPSISFECADKVIWEWVLDKYNQYKDMSDEEMMKRYNKELEIVEKKILRQFNRKMELEAALDRLEERIVLGKISAVKADEMGDKLRGEIDILDKDYMPLQDERISILDKMRQIERVNIDVENMKLDDKIKLVQQMIKCIYIERVSRTISKLYIESNMLNIDNEELLVDTYHKCIKEN